MKEKIEAMIKDVKETLQNSNIGFHERAELLQDFIYDLQCIKNGKPLKEDDKTFRDLLASKLEMEGFTKTEDNGEDGERWEKDFLDAVQLICDIGVDDFTIALMADGEPLDDAGDLLTNLITFDDFMARIEIPRKRKYSITIRGEAYSAEDFMDNFCFERDDFTWGEVEEDNEY